ncbi:MAG: hypothetical protein ABI784_10565, partial [Ginsengibacter sp.]
MRFFIVSFVICQLFSKPLQAQVAGCMDPNAPNYDPAATVSNGSCAYPDATVALKNLKKAILPGTVNEISGIIFFDGKVYGHNDSGGDPAIYEIDSTTGVITKTITLQGATNVDWEDITQDDMYVYVGDIGNNASGNRTDLKVYRFPKQDIRNIAGNSGTVPSSDIEVINFKYEDQTDFTATAANSTRYDCEAIIYDNGKLHLFTKNWIGSYTVHYVLNAIPAQGVQVAIRKDSMNTGGVKITSASKINSKTSVLLGYEVVAPPSGYMWVISGYSDMDAILETGNKQKINLGGIVDVGGGGIGQVEGITVVNPGRVFISSEYFTKTVFGVPFTVQQSLYGLNIIQWIPLSVLTNGFADLSALAVNNKMVIRWKYDRQNFDHFNVESSHDGMHFSVAGKVMSETGVHAFMFTDPALALAGGVYYRIKVIMNDGTFAYSKIISVNSQQTKHFNLNASPSPFQQAIHLSLHSDKNRQIILNLLDSHGRKILTKKWNCTKGDNQFEWQNLSSLHKSVYYITAEA